MKRYIPFIALAVIFLFIKLNGVGIRLSDSNIYFYTAYQLTQGATLYKDIFFTNFPLLPYVSVLYYFLLGGNLHLYNLTATLEVITVAFLIYKIVLEKKKTLLLPTLSSAVYFFSFVTLTTSDHQSGVFLASVFGIIGYYFLEHKKSFSSGMFFGFSLLTKAYFLPLFIASFTTVLIKDRKKLLLFLTGFFVAFGVILLPSLLFAREEIYNNIVEYSLTRSQGISKIQILRFFVMHDIILVIIFFYTLLRIKKDIFMGVLALSSILFILFYKDIYYLYLNFLIPYLAIAFSDFYITIHKRFTIQKYIIPTILIIIFIINISMYLSSYQNLQRMKNIDAIVSFLRNQSETMLYGTNDITPALAYLSDKKLLNGIVDTNENIFRKGYLNQSILTRDAIDQKALLVSRGAYYPQFNIEDQLVGGIFDRELVEEKCEIINSYPITTEGIENRLNILRCSD